VTGASGGRQDYPNYEPEPGSQIYLIKDPQLRSNCRTSEPPASRSDAEPDRHQLRCTPIYYANGTTQGNLCETVAPSFQNGKPARNEWIEQRIIGANASMYKDFPIKERFRAQIRFDYFNPFKWFNWSQAKPL